MLLQAEDTPSTATLTAAIDAALERMPPSWPLRHFVAVNPFLGLMDRHFTSACDLLRRNAGSAPLLGAAEYRAAWDRGEITPGDLASVADQAWPVDRLQRLLEDPDTSPRAIPAIPTVAEELDAHLPRPHWSRFIVDEISKWCGVWFDENQTTWRAPGHGRSLFTSWREAASSDYNPEAFGLRGFRAFVARLPENDAEAIVDIVRDLLPREVDAIDFLHRQLLSIAGWAGHVQYLVREQSLRGRADTRLRELLAIRLAYDCALFQANAHDPVFLANWRERPLRSRAPVAADLEALVRWQRAYENGYQRKLTRQLVSRAGVTQPAGNSGRPEVQAVFCIDVRSEVFRRNLETVAPGVQTVGFAGFFGFAVSHQPSGQDLATSRCPALIVPPEEGCDILSGPDRRRIQTAKAASGAWKAFQNSAISSFTFVESVGLGFAPALASRAVLPPRRGEPAFPAISGDVPTGRLAALAEAALRNMSLTRNFARLVLLCGHGGESANNPYASGLDCGACGGHAGDVNARIAVTTLNNPAVRSELARRGIEVPEDTVFVAGLHNTTTDEVTLFESHLLPDSHRDDAARLRGHLSAAGERSRAERAKSLGLPPADRGGWLRRFKIRARDISQVRPEWGLANNAAIVVAPRGRTRGLNLGGRVFLHDYEPDQDPDLRVLTLIMSAPVVVASWINLQYYASRVDPALWGAGNKTLHNIVGGIGALEGNCGDLRTGLPLQSIHDGRDFVHEPRRLSVFVETTRAAVEQVLRANDEVRQLFENGWIHLFVMEGFDVLRRTKAGWEPVPGNDPTAGVDKEAGQLGE